MTYPVARGIFQKTGFSTDGPRLTKMIRQRYEQLQPKTHRVLTRANSRSPALPTWGPSPTLPFLPGAVSLCSARMVPTHLSLLHLSFPRGPLPATPNRASTLHWSGCLIWVSETQLRDQKGVCGKSELAKQGRTHTATSRLWNHGLAPLGWLSSPGGGLSPHSGPAGHPADSSWAVLGQ